MAELTKNTEAFADVFEIDANINLLVKNIELLHYVNPLNIATEKKRFFASKFNYEPRFHYPKIKFNGYKLHRLLFSNRLNKIKNEAVRQLYEDVIYEYSGLIECIQTIGQNRKFYFNSLKSFGTPTEKDIDNAHFILQFDAEAYKDELVTKHNVTEAKAYFEAFSKRYPFKYPIKITNNLSAAAMVLNNTQTLVLKKNHKFSLNQLKVLSNHEIGVHMVTTFNGIAQPLKVFSNGFPNNVETQEGLAVYAEYMSNCLTVTRLHELAFRVIAVDSLHKGYNFSDTFHLLHNSHKLEKDKAFTITLRVHRGGGFTKDHLYLRGLKKIYKHAKAGNSLDLLLTGKVAMQYLPIIKELQNLNLAYHPKYITDAYAQNKNSNAVLDFILGSLK